MSKKNRKDNSIYLEDYRIYNSKVFTGRDRGKEVRTESKIDELEKNNEKVIIYIPAEIYSINPSFLEELFVNVVLKLGKDDFFKKFEFINEGTYDYEKVLTEAVIRILRKKTAIG